MKRSLLALWGFNLRVVVWFSCGAASACAAKLAVDAHKGEDLHIVYCNTLASEHPDNRRFLSDVEGWTGHRVEIISSMKYKTVDEVFEKERYMAGPRGARCTVEMKKVPRFDYQRADDLHIFGLTADEGRRIKLFESNNPELALEWNLRDAGVTKEQCYIWLRNAGIALPVMYSLGFKNNNCIGCVKSTSPAYWNRVRRHFPEVFQQRVDRARSLNVRLIQLHGKRIYLDELPPEVVDGVEEDIECGPVCLSENSGQEK